MGDVVVLCTFNQHQVTIFVQIKEGRDHIARDALYPLCKIPTRDKVTFNFKLKPKSKNVSANQACLRWFLLTFSKKDFYPIEH